MVCLPRMKPNCVDGSTPPSISSNQSQLPKPTQRQVGVAGAAVSALRAAKGMHDAMPKELLEEMGVQKGDKLSVQRREDGWRMSTYNADFETQMDVARKIMRKRRNLLRALAKA